MLVDDHVTEQTRAGCHMEIADAMRLLARSHGAFQAAKRPGAGGTLIWFRQSASLT